MRNELLRTLERVADRYRGVADGLIAVSFLPPAND